MYINGFLDLVICLVMVAVQLFNHWHSIDFKTNDSFYIKDLPMRDL